MESDHASMGAGTSRATSSSSSRDRTSPSPRRNRTYSLANEPMPWFGMDVGGTLTKLVYFEPCDHDEFTEGTLDGEVERIAYIHRYLISQRTYGESGLRDAHLQLDDVLINCRRGSLHFIHFPSERVPEFIALCKTKGFAHLTHTVCATGGGAYKFEAQLNQALDISLHKFDEMESLIAGLRHVLSQTSSSSECYTWQSALSDVECAEVPYDDPIAYPYLVVNMGSGVSVVAVYGVNHFKRVSGSSIGGGFFTGICALLTEAKTFSEAIELAAVGDNTKVDKLVSDIYGGDYALLNLPGDTVAASFGWMSSGDRRSQCSEADLARAALVTVTNNIGAIALNCARAENIERIVFVGNFLRVNPIASRRLAYAMHFWSEGRVAALFLRHEGYFGAVGCLLQLTEENDERRREEQRSKASSSSATPRDDIA